MPVQTRSKKPVQDSSEELHSLIARLNPLHDALDVAPNREERIRILTDMFKIVNENSEIIKLHKTLHVTYQCQIFEIASKLNADKPDERDLLEIVSTTYDLLN